MWHAECTLLCHDSNINNPSSRCWARDIPGEITWLLSTWLLESPGHQQPWYRVCKLAGFLFLRRKYCNLLHHPSCEKWWKMERWFYVSQNKFSTTRLFIYILIVLTQTRTTTNSMTVIVCMGPILWMIYQSHLKFDENSFCCYPNRCGLTAIKFCTCCAVVAYAKFEAI